MRPKPSKLLHALPLLLASLSAAPGAARAAEDALYLPPLDTAVVTLDSSLTPENFKALGAASGPSTRRDSDAARVARAFHPVFGAAVARAARGVEAIDSSGAAFVREAPVPDSARFTLTLTGLRLARRVENLPRRFVPPREPEFDPTTGAITPGVRKGYAEGPGLFTHLEARAEWELRDARPGTATRRGAAVGTATARGEPTSAQWEELARDLAKSVLKKTAFSPW